MPNGSVRVATGTRDGMAFLDVANDGALIPGKLVASLFEPFRRLSDAAARRISGLGLSIVRSVVLAHHGSHPAGPRAWDLGATSWLTPGETRAGQGSMSSATARSTAAIFLASRASGCLPRR